MNDKYGVNFLPLSYDASDYLSQTDTVECYTEDMNPEKEHVTIYIEKTKDGYSFNDNYYYYRLREPIEKYIKTCIDPVFPDSKVFISGVAAGETASLSADCTAENLFEENPAICLTGNVFIPDTEEMSRESFDDQIQIISDRLLQTGKNYIITVIKISSGQYDRLDRGEGEELNRLYIKTTHGNIGIQDKKETIIQARRISIQNGRTTIK